MAALFAWGCGRGGGTFAAWAAAAALAGAAAGAVGAGAGCRPGGGTRAGAAAAVAAEKLHAPLSALTVAAAAATIAVGTLDRAGAERLLAAAERAEPGLRRLAFVDQTGKVFASLGDPPAGGDAPDARAKDVLAATAPLLVGAAGDAAAVAGAPVVGPDGRTAGALLADVDAALLWRAIDGALGEETRCALVDPGGRAHASPAAAAAGWGADPPPGAEPLPALAGWSIGCE